MNRHRISSRSALTWVEVVAVLIVLAVLVALLLPAVETAREPARRAMCNNQLKQIGLALHNYATANKVFPPGVVCSAANIKADAASPWADAQLTTKGASGTSWILPLLPYIDLEPTLKAWDFEYGVSGGTNSSVASKNIRGLYCPTRRNALRSGLDAPTLLDPKWTGGGTDYGGCMGRHQGFLLDADQSMALPNADDKLKLCFVPGVSIVNATYVVAGDPTSADGGYCDSKKAFGMFGQVNVSTTFAAVRDGTSYTIMTGELQRITTATTVGPFNASTGPVCSHDGWAIGGSPTLFTIGYPYPPGKTTYPVMNNGHFVSPGSEHSGGANFGIGDGSVRFLSTTIDPNVLALLGSMADKVPRVLEGLDL